MAGVERIVARVLAARGLSDPDQAAAFMNPTLRELHDPSLMPGLDRAAVRILEAARAGERIVVYGDYDVDGITATVILCRTIRALCPHAAVSAYVPHRLDEGYGLNEEAIRQLASSGARLIVSVDCGITAAGPAQVAARAGVDLIVTDHHNLPEEPDGLPRAAHAPPTASHVPLHPWEGQAAERLAPGGAAPNLVRCPE